MGKMIKDTIHAKGIEIGIYTNNFENEFISLTDIAKYRNEDEPSAPSSQKPKFWTAWFAPLRR